MPAGVHLGLADVLEERRHGLILVRGAARRVHHPQAGAADDRVERRARHVVIVRQEGHAPLELRLVLDAGAGGRRGHDDPALAGGEEHRRGPIAAAVLERVLLRHVHQGLQVAHLQVGVEFQLRVHAHDAVRLGRQRDVVQRGEVLQLRPGRPFEGHAALGRAAVHQLLGRCPHLGPGLGRLGGVEAGLLEGVNVEVHHRGRAIQRHRDHVVAFAVIAAHGLDVDAGIEIPAGLFRQLIHRLDRALGRHHRCGAHLEHLHDVRGFAGAIRGNRRIHCVGVRAFVDRVHIVFVLRLVEVHHHGFEHIAQGLAQAEPELDDDAIGERRRPRRGRDGRRGSLRRLSSRGGLGGFRRLRRLGRLRFRGLGRLRGLRGGRSRLRRRGGRLRRARREEHAQDDEHAEDNKQLLHGLASLRE